MQVTINPYHRSVSIDGNEIIQRILPFPDDANSIASITCTYNQSTREITEVSDIHRYVNHYISKEYYFRNLPKFIDWYYKEKQAQEQAQTLQQKEVAAVQQVITEARETIDDITTEFTAILEEDEQLVASTVTFVQNIKNELTEIKENISSTLPNVLTQIEETILNATGTLPIRLTEDLPKRSLIDKSKDIVNVKDYGAVGDGLADDTCAFDLAIEVATAVYAPLYIPTGLYKIDKLPSIPAIGSGRIIIEDSESTEPSIYHALDLLFANDGGIVRDKETNKYKIQLEPEEPEEPDEGEDDGDVEGPLAPVNTQYIIDENGEWEVPFTGYYSIMLLGGGNGGYISRYSDTKVLLQGGESGTVNHFYKYLEKGTLINITIGQGGKGYNTLGVGDASSPSDREGGITEFDIHTSHNYPNRHYHTNKITTDGYAEMVGASLGGGWYDSESDTLMDGAYYGAGGAALVDMENNIFKVSNGHRGAVILLYCDTPNKSTTAALTTHLSNYTTT